MGLPFHSTDILPSVMDVTSVILHGPRQPTVSFASLLSLPLCCSEGELDATVQVAEVTTGYLRTTYRLRPPCRPNNRRRRGAVLLEYPRFLQECLVTTSHLRGSGLAPGTNNSVSFSRRTWLHMVAANLSCRTFGSARMSGVSRISPGNSSVIQ